MEKFDLRTIRFLSIFIFASIFHYSCKHNPSIVTRKDLKEITLPELLSAVDSSKSKFHYLNAKISVDLKNSKTGHVSFKGKLRICSDSALWVSVTPALGIEMARMMATDVEFGIINYLQKEFFKGDFESVKNNLGYPLNMNLLQSMLLGDPVFLNPTTDLQLGIQKGMYFISTLDSRSFEKVTSGNDNQELGSKVVQGCWILGDNHKLGKMTVYDASTKSLLNAQFEGYSGAFGKVFPTIVNFKLESPTQQMDLKIEFSKIEFQEELDFPFHIPENYKPMKM